METFFTNSFGFLSVFCFVFIGSYFIGLLVVASVSEASVTPTAGGFLTDDSTAAVTIEERVVETFLD